MRPFVLLIASCAAFVIATPAFAEETQIAAIDYTLPSDNNEPRPAGHQAPPSEEPEEPTSNVSFDASITVADGRIFQDQRLVLSHDPVTEISANLTVGDVTFGLWHAESLVGRRDDRETDLTASMPLGDVGDVSVSGQVGVYFIPGFDPVYEAKLTLSRDLGHGCGADLSAEIMRDGFVDEVLRGQVSCELQISERVSVDLTPSVSLSDYGGGFSFGGEAGLSYRLTNHLGIRGFVEGFTSSIGSGHRFGVTLTFRP